MGKTEYLSTTNEIILRKFEMYLDDSIVNSYNTIIQQSRSKKGKKYELNDWQKGDAKMYSRGYNFFDYTLCKQDIEMSSQIQDEVKKGVIEPIDPEEEEEEEDDPEEEECADDDYRRLR